MLIDLHVLFIISGDKFFQEVIMTIERIVLAIAGLFVFLSAVLSVYHHPYWLYFTGFVGLNLFQSAFTGFCPLAMILKAMGFKSAAETANPSAS
jgi:hypothetical protein